MGVLVKRELYQEMYRLRLKYPAYRVEVDVIVVNGMSIYCPIRVFPLLRTVSFLTTKRNTSNGLCLVKSS